MPTPFTHINTAQRMLSDPLVPRPYRELLGQHLPAYMLGSVAADARVGSGIKRSDTHFYDYHLTIQEAPWRVMIKRNPRLLDPIDDAHRAFVAAYVAHLSIDEIWSLRMVRPHFAEREWAGRWERFYMLHIILCYMDERDELTIEPWVADALRHAAPINWLDFINDMQLCDWRDLIHQQLLPGEPSQTLEIFGGRIEVPPADMRALLDSPETLRLRLWQHIPQPLLHRVEHDAYAYARQQMVTYLQQSC